MAIDRLWTCARCEADNPPRAAGCRKCGLARARAVPRPGGPGSAALLSGLLPGLGQIYQERWVRGMLMLLLPVLGLTLCAALTLYAEPLTRVAVRNVGLVTLLIIGGLFAYHSVVVGDAFAGGLGGGDTRRRSLTRVADYLVLAVVILALAGVYGVVYRESAAWAAVVAKVFEPIAGAPAMPPGHSPAPQWTGKDRLNVLLLGLDSRVESTESLNTDTMIVLSLDPLNRSAAMLSIPRDTFVAIPGHRQDKINAAYAYGGRNGPDLARRTVEGLLNVPIHSYALIDFPAFTKIIDSFGGVLIDAKRPLRDEEYPTADFGIERVHLLAGPQLLDGPNALRYARSRHDSNDFGRARRQQEVLAALRARLAQGGLARIPTIVDKVGTGVQTNVDPGIVLPLARTGVAIDGGAIRSEVLRPCGVPGEPRCELREEQSPLGYYLIPDKSKIADLVAALFYDPKMRQEAARVEVRSSGARPVTVRTTAERLEARSFTIARVAEGDAAGSAVILRNNAKRHTAETLARQLGLTVTTDAAEGADADIVVRLGSDFRGLASDLLR